MLLRSHILIVLEGCFTLGTISTILNIVMLQLAICAIQHIHHPKQLLYTAWGSLSCGAEASSYHLMTLIPSGLMLPHSKLHTVL